MTLEHIANQGKATEIDLVAMVGNLLYVDLDLNDRLGNKTFGEKQKILIRAKGVWVDDYIPDATKWGQDEIEQRTLELAGEAYDKLWAF